jgi:hypothetical protein
MEQIANQSIELNVSDQVGGGLAQHRPAQNAREAQHRLTAAGMAAWSTVLADQLALHAENSSLQWDEAKILADDPIWHSSWGPEPF